MVVVNNSKDTLLKGNTLPRNTLPKPMASLNTAVLNTKINNKWLHNSSINKHHQERAAAAMAVSVPVWPRYAAAVSLKRDAKLALTVLNAPRAAAKHLNNQPLYQLRRVRSQKEHGQR